MSCRMCVPIALTSLVVWSRMPCPDQDIVSDHFDCPVQVYQNIV